MLADYGAFAKFKLTLDTYKNMGLWVFLKNIHSFLPLPRARFSCTGLLPECTQCPYTGTSTNQEKDPAGDLFVCITLLLSFHTTRRLKACVYNRVPFRYIHTDSL